MTSPFDDSSISSLIADAVAKEAVRIEVARRLDAITLERNKIEQEHRAAQHESRLAEGRIKTYVWNQASKKKDEQ